MQGNLPIPTLTAVKLVVNGEEKEALFTFYSPQCSQSAIRKKNMYPILQMYI
jgi:hypothetical protein